MTRSSTELTEDSATNQFSESGEPEEDVLMQPATQTGGVAIGRADQIHGSIIAGRDVIIGRPWGKWAWIPASATLVAALVLIAVLVVAPALHLGRPERMTGDFRVAVAGFLDQGRTGRSRVGCDIAQSIYDHLDKAFAEPEDGLIMTVWRPAWVGTVEGRDAKARAEWAAGVARRIEADIVVYGTLTATIDGWQVTPEFWVGDQRFYDAQEVTGAHALGESFPILRRWGIFERIEVGADGESRVKALSWIAIGLAFYAAQDYQQALTYFQSAEAVDGWPDQRGKEVLYLLLGNATDKWVAAKVRGIAKGDNALAQEEIDRAVEDLDTARHYYRRSLELDPEYARAFIGLGDVDYMEALLPFARTGNLAAIDLNRLGEAASVYQQALDARDQPPLSDIAAKVHFGLGQCHMMQALAGSGCAEMGPAFDEFEMVIEAYGAEQNERLTELAGEAHGRQGFMHQRCDRSELALEEYDLAASILTEAHSNRADYYQQAAQELRDNGKGPP